MTWTLLLPVWKAFTSNRNQIYASDIPRNPLQSYLVFHSNLDLLLKISFWANFYLSYYIILSYLVKKQYSKEHERKRWETRWRQAGEIAFVYQNNKRNESVTVASNNHYIYLENQAFSTVKLPQSFRLRAISHFYWCSNSEVFVDGWLSLEKSIGEFSMVYKKWALWCGLGPIIKISACNSFNSTRFV